MKFMGWDWAALNACPERVYRRILVKMTEAVPAAENGRL